VKKRSDLEHNEHVLVTDLHVEGLDGLVGHRILAVLEAPGEIMPRTLDAEFPVNLPEGGLAVIRIVGVRLSL